MMNEDASTWREIGETKFATLDASKGRGLRKATVRPMWGKR